MKRSRNGSTLSSRTGSAKGVWGRGWPGLVLLAALACRPVMAEPTPAPAARGEGGGACRVGADGVVSPDAVKGTQVDVTVLTNERLGEISPYVYGVNTDEWRRVGLKPDLVRLGGNRWSAYNWENNASHAGSDWKNQNDAFLGGGDRPGEAVRSRVARAFEAGASVLVTVPILERVAADKDKGGDVARTPGYREKRFVENRPEHPGKAAYPPKRDDGAVYQDEFVAWLEGRFPAANRDGQRIFYALDNEPALWPTTHPRIHPDPPRYEEVIERSIAFARAVKKKAPDALVFGPVSYGWMGMANLQNAPDARGRHFLATYLDAMRQAEKKHGRRLLDVLDVHWYPEVRVGGRRVTRDDSDAALARARLQATRSMWDPEFTEDSWIGKHGTGGPITLITRLQKLVDTHYPGTRLALTEYYFGGGGDVSGALAQADMLGILGREGVFAAALWPMGDDRRFVYAAFDAYLDFDGQGGRFGDRAVKVTRLGDRDVDVYAAVHADHPDRVTAVVINKSDRPREAALRLAHAGCLSSAESFRLTGKAPEMKPAGRPAPAGRNAFRDTLPPRSVTTYLFSP